MPNEFESLNQIFWISIAVTILIFLFYLKSYLRRGYPRQKSKKNGTGDFFLQKMRNVLLNSLETVYISHSRGM